MDEDEDGFEELWEFIAKAGSLDCTQLEPFEGVDVKWEKLIKERDVAEQKFKASKVYLKVMLELVSLFAFMFVRVFLVPRFLAGLIATGMLGWAGHTAFT